MNITYFTISSFHYTNITSMMINSFLKNVPDSKLYILCLNNLQNEINHERIIYINCEFYLLPLLKNVIQNIRGVINSRSAFLLKSLIINYVPVDASAVVYIDSDSLIFNNLNNFVYANLAQDRHKLYISSDHTRNDLAFNNKYHINTGFWFCDLHKYPLKALSHQWSSDILNMYANPEESKKNKVLWKYVDQPVLCEILKQGFFQHTILDPNLISIKYRRESSIICHYFSRYARRMISDYNSFTIQP